MHTNDIAKFLKSKNIPSCDIIIYKNHKEIYRFFCGSKDAAKAVPLKGDELYNLYSASKVITCAAALRLVERGIIGLDDPVSKYIPEYASLTYKSPDGVRPCQKAMTVRHLFAMRGGLDYDLKSEPILALLRETDGKADTVSLVKSFIKAPLAYEPGEGFMYSLCHDVLGAIIEIASGKRLGEYLKSEIFDPLGMNETGFFPTEEQKKRFAAQYVYKNGVYEEIPKNEVAYRLSENYESGGAGLFSSVNDYIKFADALACGGTAYNGYQVLKPETVTLMRQDQQTPDTPPIVVGYKYALGVRSMFSKEEADSDGDTEQEFGWGGAAGAHAVIDPKNGLSLFYAQHVLDHGPVYSDIPSVLRDSMYYIKK